MNNASDNPTKRKISLGVIFRNILLVLLDVSVMILTVLIMVGVYFYTKTPLNKEFLTHGASQTSIIYDRTGDHVLYEIHGEENRKVISHDQIPDTIRKTTIAAEDHDFYSHPGINPISIIRAIVTNIESNEIQQGASTITQQLARNTFLSRDKTFRRKILEIALAMKIERKYSKDDILDMYLNEVPYGSNAYGIESAAQTFFGKEAKDLTLDQAAVLAALPKAPTVLSPYGNNTTELINRKDKILDEMVDLKLASKEDAVQAKNSRTLAGIIPAKQAIDSPHFVFYIREQLEKQYGQDMVENGGFKVYTTLDYDMQKLAEKTVEQNAQTLLPKYGATNAALVALDPKTGQILAMVGSKDYYDKSIDGQVNVTTSPRQPGSSFKPFAYAEAFVKGYQPETFIWDVPTNFGPDGSGHDYTPHDYDGKWHGLKTMREALAQSLNVPAVKTLYLAGVNDTIDLAHRMGITTLNEKNRYGLALVLGGGEVTLLDETSGYSVFANDGQRNPATGIMKIVDSQGKIFYQSKPANTSVLDNQIARKINSILSDNDARVPIFGPNNKLFIPGKIVAAKTGTTQEFHDAWTVGYTPSLAVGVWAGNNDNTAMRAGADGSYVAAPIWHQFMAEALNKYPQEQFADYNRSSIENNYAMSDPVITYYDRKNGKQISDEKRSKMNPDRVEMRVAYPNNSPGPDQSNVAELQNTTDPMIRRWRNSLRSPESFDPNNPPPGMF